MNDYGVHVASHLALAGTALLCGLLLGLFSGYAAYRRPRASGAILGAVAGLRVIPSVAVLVVLIPWLGIGFLPALLALTVLATAPIALAVEQSLRSVAPPVIECARAMGMPETLIRSRVIWPLALPLMMGGVRTAAVEVIASATLAAFVGAGGLGEYIVEGLADGDIRTLLMGGITVSMLAWLTEFAMTVAGRAISRRYAVG